MNRGVVRSLRQIRVKLKYFEEEVDSSQSPERVDGIVFGLNQATINQNIERDSEEIRSTEFLSGIVETRNWLHNLDCELE